MAGSTLPDSVVTEIRRDLELLVSSRDRGLRLMSRIPRLLQVRVPEDPRLIRKPREASVAFLMHATEWIGTEDGQPVQTEALRILLGLTPEAAGSFKTARCDAIADLYARRGLTPRSGKVVATKVPGLLARLTEEIVLMEEEATDWREGFASRDPAGPSKYQPSWLDVDHEAKRIAYDIVDAGHTVDTVVAIARGGLALGLRLAHLLDVRSFGTITAWKCPTGPRVPGRPRSLHTRFEAIGLPEGTPGTVAIVDDTLRQGCTMLNAKRLVQHHYAPHEPRVVFAALYRIKRDAPDRLPREFDGSLFGADVWPGEDKECGWITLPWEEKPDGNDGRP